MDMSRRAFAQLMGVTSLAALSGCAQTGTSNGQTSDTTADAPASSAPQAETSSTTAQNDAGALRHATLTIEGYGTIKLELDASAAPQTVANFCELADSGFYDGLTFHRIIAGFMIQGGDPLGNGTGGASNQIPGEFASNGFDNPISHVRGTISMARAQDPNSASSQFFIMHQDALYLDGEYAGFGHVTEGIEVVDAICETVQPIDSNGTVLPEDQPRISSITIDD